MKLDTPNGPAVDGSGGLTTQWTAWTTRVTNFVTGRSRSGTTAQRPTKNYEIGTPYFDTTLGKPIWIKSTGPVVWVDATGGVV